MKNTVIKGDGTSRKLKAPSDIPTTFGDWRAQLLAGNATLDIALNADGCETVGTPLSKENLLSDTIKTALGLTSEDPTINEALAIVKTALDAKQDASSAVTIYNVGTKTAGYARYAGNNDVSVNTYALRNEAFYDKNNYSKAIDPTIAGYILWLYG